MWRWRSDMDSGESIRATIAAMPAQTVGPAGRPRGVARPAGAARVATISPTWPPSPSIAPLWRWTIMGPQDEAGLRRWVDTALANAEAGTERPFATIDLATGRAIGSSRFMSIVPEHKRLEIGWTWVGDRVPADRREPRGEAPPADPRVRDARGQPRRVQDPLAERALADRAGRASARRSRASSATT